MDDPSQRKPWLKHTFSTQYTQRFPLTSPELFSRYLRNLFECELFVSLFKFPTHRLVFFMVICDVTSQILKKSVQKKILQYCRKILS